MAGGKGGSTTTTVEVPEYIEEAAKRNLARADTISQIGFAPYYGPDIAAQTAMQQAAAQNVADTAGAFGLRTTTGQDTYGMPEPTTYAGGIRGYSSAPMYEQALGELATRRPAQFNLIESLFINPVTGQVGANVGSPVAPVIDATAPMIDTTSPVVGGVVGGGTAVERPPYVGPIFDPSTDPYGPTVVVDDVLDAYETLTPDVLPPVVPAVGGDAPAVGDIIDNDLLKQQQNQVVVDAFKNFGDVLNNPNLTAEQKAAANPAFNPEIAEAAKDVPVMINTPQGSYTVPAGELGSSDFAAATGGTYTPPSDPTGLGTFTGGTGGDVADIMEQYQMAGSSVGAAGIRNIGGAYAQSPAGSGDLVETRYNPETGQSEIISVGVPFEPITQSQRDFQTELFAADDVSQFLPPQAEDTFGTDLYRSLTDPYYDPEGTVLSRALGGLFDSTAPAPQIVPDNQSVGQERKEQEVLNLASQIGAQGVLDVATNLDANQIKALGAGTLTSSEVAEQVQAAPTVQLVTQKGLREGTVTSSGDRHKDNRKIIQQAANEGNLGAVVDAFAQEYMTGGKKISDFQEKTGISPTILQDLEKLAKAKGY